MSIFFVFALILKLRLFQLLYVLVCYLQKFRRRAYYFGVFAVVCGVAYVFRPYVSLLLAVYKRTEDSKNFTKDMVRKFKDRDASEETSFTKDMLKKFKRRDVPEESS